MCQISSASLIKWHNYRIILCQTITTAKYTDDDKHKSQFPLASPAVCLHFHSGCFIQRKHFSPPLFYMYVKPSGYAVKTSAITCRYCTCNI